MEEKDIPQQQEMTELVIREVSLDEIEIVEEAFVPCGWGAGCGSRC